MTDSIKLKLTEQRAVEVKLNRTLAFGSGSISMSLFLLHDKGQYVGNHAVLLKITAKSMVKFIWRLFFLL